MMHKVTWKSPANIALVKYWGKYGDQFPANPSLSMSLTESTTTTSVTCEQTGNSEIVSSFKFHGESKPEFESKVNKFLKKVQEYFPFISNSLVLIESENNFPHSSGISSSASFMSSLALCLCHLENLIAGKETVNESMLQKASFIARLGSGSASRSVYGKYSVWGLVPELEGSSNEYAIPLKKPINSYFQNFFDAILIVSSKPKSLLSSKGHLLMDSNPYAQTRYKSASVNLKNLLHVLEAGNHVDFIRIVENEALSLHAMMMTSDPWQILMEPNTIEIIRRIRDYRNATSSKICFTLDAGPNIHLLYSYEEREDVIHLIKNELLPFCENGKWVDDRLGNGPQLLQEV